MSSNIALVREQRVFACLETTKGTPVFPTGAVAAQGTITMSGVSIAEETFAIGGQTFTWKAARAATGQVTIGASAAEAVTNIVEAVGLDLTNVTAEDGAGDTVVLTATSPGKAGNAIVLTTGSTNMAVDGTGTLGATRAGSDGEEIIAAGVASINQQPSFTDSPEIRNSRDIMARFVDMFPPGEWSVPILSRPDGAGNAPMGDVFFRSLFGTKTIVPATSCAYTQALEKPSFTLWVQRGHTVFFLTGSTTGSGKRSLGNKGAALWEMSGQGMKMGWAGKGALNADEAAGQTVISVADCRLFTANSRIWNVTKDDDNSGAGYRVTDRSRSVDGATDTITIDPAVPAGGWSNADVIQGFLPVGLEIGTPIENRKSVLKIDTVATTIKSLSLTFNDPAKYLDDEIPANEEDYVTEYVEDARNIEGDIGLNFRKENLSHFYDAIENASAAIEVISGTTAGYREKISLPYCSKEVPTVEDNAPVVGLSMKIKAIGSAGEDSASLTFY